MRKKRIVFVMCFIMGLLFFCPQLSVKSMAYESAWFPASQMNLSQVAYEVGTGSSHGNYNAIDILPGGRVFAPFTGIVKQVDSRWGYVLLQSTDKVYFADGSLDYMTVGFMHDENISDISVGQKITQGTAFYDAGGQGQKSDGSYGHVYGNHVDISVFKGAVNSVSSYGNGNIYAYKAFFINKSKTTSIINKGKVESGHTTNNGAPTDWSNLWKELGATNSIPTTRTVKDGNYVFTPWYNGSYAVGVKNKGTSNGDVLELQTKTGDAAQTWKVKYIKDGYYSVTQYSSGKAMDCGTSKQPGTQLNLWTYYSNAMQQHWYIVPDSDGTYTLAPVIDTNLRLDVYNNTMSAGTKIQIYTNNASAAQKFRLVSNEPEGEMPSSRTVKDGNYVFTPWDNGSYAVGVKNKGTSNGDVLELQTKTGDAAQTWKVKYIKDGYYSVTQYSSGKAMDCGTSKQPGTQLNLWTYYSNAMQQHWYIIPDSDGTYTLAPVIDTNLRLDVYNNTMSTGTKIQIYTNNKSAAQKFRLVSKVTSMKLSPTAYTYTGGVKTPAVTVEDDNGKTLTKNVDYSVSYASGRKYVGTYKVMINLKGNYIGSRTLSFKINPKGTSINSLSRAKKAFTVKWKKQNTQTSGYQIVYSTSSKFTSGNKYVTVKSNKTTANKITKLKAKKKYYVKVRTYKTVNGTRYYSNWSSAKTVTTK